MLIKQMLARQLSSPIKMVKETHLSSFVLLLTLNFFGLCCCGGVVYKEFLCYVKLNCDNSANFKKNIYFFFYMGPHFVESTFAFDTTII